MSTNVQPTCEVCAGPIEPGEAVVLGQEAEGMTLLMVTHEMRFAESVSDKVVFMADGAIVEQGPPGQVFRAPEMERTRAFLRAIEDH